MECLTSLIGLKSLCVEDSTTPLFFLDDIEGLDVVALSNMAKASNGTGKKFGEQIIDLSSRMLIADVESLIPKGYSIKSSLNNFCNVCTYSSLSTASPETGIVIKNISNSTNAYLSVDSLTVKIASTGNYNIALVDGIETKFINADFTAGVEKVITNINYKTSAKSVRLYFLESPVNVYALICPTTKGCGCSGSTSKQSRDIQVKGLLAGNESTTQYGFVPCASIICSMDNILCSIVQQQPKLFALTLLYRAAARYFSESPVTERLNTTASFNKEEKQALADFYLDLYYERLRGSDKVKGIADNMAAALNNLQDDCVDCKRMNTTTWAVG